MAQVGRYDMAEKLQCRRQQRAADGGVDGLGAGLLRKLLTGGVAHQWQVRVSGDGQPQAPREPDLARRRVQQVGATDDRVHSLRRVIHHYGKLVGELSVGSQQDEIADGGGHILPLRSLHAIVENDLLVWREHAPGACVAPVRQAGTAGARVYRGTIDPHCRCAGGNLAPRAGAGVDVAVVAQLAQRGAIGITASALVEDLAIPLEGESGERAQDGVGGTGSGSLPVDVLDAQQPVASARTRIEIAADGRDERAEVQRARRRRGKAATAGSRVPAR